MDEKWLDGQSALFRKRRERREHDRKLIEGSRKSIKAADVELAWEAKNGNWMAPLITPENGFATRTMEVDVHVYPPATVSMTHKHNEAVLFVLRGTGHVVINDEQVEYAPGDTVFIPHGLWHQIVNSHPTEPTVVLAMKNHALMEHLGELNIDYRPDPPTTNEAYSPGKFTEVLPLAEWSAGGRTSSDAGQAAASSGSKLRK